MRRAPENDDGDIDLPNETSGARDLRATPHSRQHGGAGVT